MADQVINDIKDRLNITEVIGGYIEVKKSGGNFKAVCPFHSERTASLMISPQKQIWHCFGCFPPGQKIKTPFGLHNIEEIPEDHYVVSGTGALKKVLATHKRNFEGNLVDIKVRKLGGIVSLTEDHQVYVVRGVAPYLHTAKNFYRRYARYVNLHQDNPKKYFAAIDKYMPLLKRAAGSLQEGDFLLYPIDDLIADVPVLNLKDYLTKSYTKGPVPKAIPYEVNVDEKFLRLLGYYIAEGSNHRAYIRFSLGNHEQKFAEEIVVLIKDIFGLSASIHKRDPKTARTGLEVTACHSFLADIFENLCGKGASSKHIPYIFQQIPPNLQMVLLSAIHKGDGHDYIPHRSVRTHRSITTVSKVLAEQLVDVLLRNNIYPSLNISSAKRDNEGVNHQESYNVNWSEVAQAQHRFVYYQPDGSKYWLLPVRSLVKQPYRGPVYNLTVADDHSYVARNFAVANCGEGGDVFGFVMRYESLDFRETLELLAERAGVALPKYQGTKTADSTDDLLRINSFAAEVYHRYLNSQPGAEAVRKYLHGRGLTEPTVELWRIGFAPNSYDYLQKALTEKKIPFDRMVAAGVASRSDRGQNFDRFRNRITFPIFNYRGDTVGFSARILPGDDSNSAKYVNSPETAIYNKSKILFGLNFAKEAIRKAGEAVIVEGQMDTIQAHQAGFTNTVATSGTALTEDHLRLLGRLTKQLKFCFDADAAGLAATQRAGKLALQMGFGVKIIVLEKAKDPDELIQASASLWQKTVKEAVWFVDFYLNQADQQFADGSLEQKQYLNEMVIPLLSYISNPVEQDHYIKQLSQKFGISERVIRDAAKKPKDNFAAPASANAAAAPTAPLGSQPQNVAEKQILGGLLAFPEFLASSRTEGLPIEAFSLPLQELVRQALAGSITAETASDTLAKEAVFMVESGLDEVADDRNVYLRDLQTSANLLKLTHLKRQLQDLTVHISKAQASANTEMLSELNQRFAALTAQRVQLENQL